MGFSLSGGTHEERKTVQAGFYRPRLRGQDFRSAEITFCDFLLSGQMLFKNPRRQGDQPHGRAILTLVQHTVLQVATA